MLCVSNGRFFKCTKPTRIRERLAISGIDYQYADQDGVDLHSGPFLRRRLEKYLASKTPLGACRYCLGTSGPEFDHHQMKAAELKSELLADDTDAVDRTRWTVFVGH